MSRLAPKTTNNSHNSSNVYNRSISSIDTAEEIKALHLESKLTPTSYHQVVTAMVLRAEENFCNKVKYFVTGVLVVLTQYFTIAGVYRGTLGTMDPLEDGLACKS